MGIAYEKALGTGRALHAARDRRTAVPSLKEHTANAATSASSLALAFVQRRHGCFAVLLSSAKGWLRHLQ